MSLVEWAGVLTGIACVWLTTRQNVWAWPIGIANSALFMVLFVPARLYADSALQVVYIVLGFYGWWHWLYGNPAARDALPVRRTPRAEAALLAGGALAVFVVMGVVLDRVTDTDVPWWDAFPTTLSLVAQYLLTRKYLANWAVWIFGVNLPFLALYWYKDLTLVAGLQLVFIALSVKGWVDWRRALTRDDASLAVEPDVHPGPPLVGLDPV
jgi:nicotinamide mononucleotide transporter